MLWHCTSVEPPGGWPLDNPVAQRIRELIVSAVLEPGSRVTEAMIAERLGVSRTPVRNALPALAAEGLLESAGKRGFAVRAFSLEDSLRATELRCLLEALAARELAHRRDRGISVAALRQTLARGDEILRRGYVVADDEQSYASMNERFHEIIVEGARNPLLLSLLQRVYQVPLVGPGVVPFNRVPIELIYPLILAGHHQHHAIVDAIDAGEGAAAESMMRAHVIIARRSLGLDEISDGTPG